MNEIDRHRLLILEQMDRCEIPLVEAAKILGLSRRQTQRLLVAYRTRGAAAARHGNRGRPPANVVEPELRERIVALARGPAAGCNGQEFTEMLAKLEGIVLHASTVRRILMDAGITLPRTRRRKGERATSQDEATDLSWTEGERVEDAS